MAMKSPSAVADTDGMIFTSDWKADIGILILNLGLSGTSGARVESVKQAQGFLCSSETRMF